MSEGYSVSDVTRLLGVSRSIVSEFIKAGVVAPSRGRRGEYRFSFPDLVVLRTARALTEAKLPPARIVRSLRRLRAKLPESMPLTGLHVEAVGGALVVSEGGAQWQPDDGQYVLRFSVQAAGGKVAFIEPQARAVPEAPLDWFARALALESQDVAAACDAYRKALRHDARHVEAYVNLGLCLYNSGDLDEAERVYRAGLAHCGSDALLLFNLAVLLEDRERLDEAVELYRRAVAGSPDFADAHWNLALLCRKRGLAQEALRHLKAYRKLKA